MDRLEVKEVTVAESAIEAYGYLGDDGWPASKCFYPVCCTTADGRNWYLPQGQRTKDEEGFTFYAYAYRDAERVAERVRRLGSIDPDLWVEVEPIDLEEAWGAEAAMRERADCLMEEFQWNASGRSPGYGYV